MGSTKSKVRILKEIIREVLRVEPAGSKKEDEWVQEQIRKQDEERKRREENNKPQIPIISEPPKTERKLPTFPVYTTLPELPVIQPIPPSAPSGDRSNPNDPTTSLPAVDSEFEEQKRQVERERAQKERDEAKQAQREQAQRDQEEKILAERGRLERQQSEERRRQSDKRQDETIKGLEESSRERYRFIEDSRRALPDHKSPFGIPASYVLQISGSSNEAAFGDKLAKTILLSMETGVLKDEVFKSMQELLTPESLAAMGGFIAIVGSGNLAAAAIAPPIGPAIAAVVDAAMAVLIVGGNAATLWEASTALAGFLTKANDAKTDAEFLAAAKDFAKFANAVGPDVVSKMTGAAAGKALGAIGSKLASVAGELGKLLPEKQKQIGDGLRAGSDLLNKVGTKVTDGFKSIFKHIDETLKNLSGDKSKNLTGSTASPNPGKDPNKKNKRIQSSRWDKISDEIKLDLGKDKPEFKELEINLGKLKAKGLHPETVIKLHKQGLLPSKLDKLLEDIRKFEKLVRGTDKAIKPEFQELAELTNKFLDQISKHPEIINKVEKAKNFIQYAVADRQIYKFAKEILNSEKLENIDGLGEAVKDFATQPGISGALGYQFEVEFAAQLVRSGSEISMGKGADVVNHTNKQAWQLKNVNEGIPASKDKEGSLFRTDLNVAAKQLTGANGEKPPLGYLKGIKLRITNPESPEYLKSPKQLEELIKKSVSTSERGKWTAVDQVQIIIKDKTHVFDIKKGLEGIVPIYQNTYKSAPYSVSEIPAETKVAQGQNTSSQLLSALERYRQVAKNSSALEQSKEMQMSPQMLVARESVTTQQKLHKIGQNIQNLNTQVAGQTFNTREISPSILRNASPTDLKAVAYASAQLLKHSGQQAFVSRESELEVSKINDTGQVTLYSHRLSVETAQNILEAAQQLQQEQTMQTARNNQRNFEIGG